MSNIFPINDTLLDILGVTALCSFMAEVFFLVTYALNKKYLKGTHMKLVIYLILADLLESISNFGFFFTGNNDTACVANGATRLFGLLWSLMWVAIISHYSVFLVSKEETEPNFQLYRLIAFSIPFIFCVIPLYGNITGAYDGYVFDLVGCLGTPQMMLAVLFGPVLLIFIYIINNYLKIKRLTEKIEASKGKVSNIFKYPVFLICCWIPGLVARIGMVLYGNQTPFVMEILLIVGLHSMGLVNGVFYGYLYRNILAQKKLKDNVPNLDESNDIRVMEETLKE